MSYQVFARKYRPRTFEDVLGQDHVVRTLRNAIEKERIAQAYLFVGPRGTGKTSTARILAKALNCPGGPKADFDADAPICEEIAQGRSLDVLEIDGASNNGVEQVRELRETVQYSPAQGRYKIYYIDEVHMLSNAAFNALLKTLEEPPEHVKFIFATTEPHKILPTIVSRCQRFDLRRIPDEIIANHLLHIAEVEGIALDESAAFAIARGAEGGMRDAQSMLDQLVAFCGERIVERDVEEVFGITSWETVADLARALLERDSAGALSLVSGHHEAGRDLQRLLGDLVRHWRNLVVWRVDGGASLAQLGEGQRRLLAQQAELADTEHLLLAADELSDCLEAMRLAADRRLVLDLALVRVVRSLESVSLDDVLAFLQKQGADPDAVAVIERAVSSSPAEVLEDDGQGELGPAEDESAQLKGDSNTGDEEAVNEKAVDEEKQRALDAKRKADGERLAQQKREEMQRQQEEKVRAEVEEKARVENEVKVKADEKVKKEAKAENDAVAEKGLSFDGPLRSALPEEPVDEQEGEREQPYDDSDDYGGSLFDQLTDRIEAGRTQAGAEGQGVSAQRRGDSSADVALDEQTTLAGNGRGDEDGADSAAVGGENADESDGVDQSNEPDMEDGAGGGSDELLSLHNHEKFWQSFVERLPERLGMVKDVLETGRVLALADELLSVGFPQGQQFAYESFVVNQQSTLVKLLREWTGRSLELKLAIDASVPEPVLEEPEPAQPPPRAQAADPEPRVELEPVSREKDQESFENDPAIARALKLFEAEVLDS